MMQSIELKTVRNEFLSKLQKDVENISSSKNILLFSLIKVQIFTKSHESTMKNFSKIILSKLTKEQVLVRKEKLTKNQSNLRNISELMIEWNVTLTNMHL